MMSARVTTRESAQALAKPGKPVPGRMPVAPLPAAGRPASGACACGGSCPRCRDPVRAQPKLMVGAPDDACEREADRIATALISSGAGSHWPAAEHEKRAVQRAPAALGELAIDGAAEEVVRELGEGRPLDAGARAFFEPHLGHDLGGVRVHTGARAAESADRLGARAYTLGRDIVFGAGSYAPDTASGRHLLAHELVHVVQQGAAATRETAVEGARSASPQGAALAPGAYSVRLIADGGERILGPPSEEPGPGAGGEAPAQAATPTAGAPEPLSAQPEETPQTVPVQRMAKSEGGASLWIQRASFTKPTPKAEDPLARMEQGLTPGLTTPKINGVLKPSAQQFLDAISPSKVIDTGGTSGKTTCQFDGFSIDTTADQIVASAAPAGGWTRTVAFGNLPAPPECAKVAKVRATMNAQPSNADFVTRVQNSEDEHANDLKWLHDRYLTPFDSFVNGLKGTGTDLQDCANNLVGLLGFRTTEAAYEFSQGWKASLKKLDGPQGTHLDNAVVRPATKTCSGITVTASQARPAIAGAAPGNVVTVAPTVTAFDPKTLKADGTDLKDGKTVVKSFSKAGDAAAALAAIQHYGMTSRNVIGPLEYFLVGAAAPSGALKGANELAIDPSSYQVTEGVPNAGEWAITDTSATAGGINVNVIANFGAKRDEAYSAWSVLTSFGFTRQCWIGGTRQKPEMMYFRT